jgi:hypothetical protein
MKSDSAVVEKRARMIVLISEKEAGERDAQPDKKRDDQHRARMSMQVNDEQHFQGIILFI